MQRILVSGHKRTFQLNGKNSVKAIIAYLTKFDVFENFLVRWATLISASDYN